VLSYGTPRNFQLRESVQTGVTEKGNPKMGAGAVVWEKALPSNSLLVVSGAANTKYMHAVPKDKQWAGDTRYSLIFRTIREEVQAMPPPAPQSPAPAPATAAAQSPMEQQMAQMMVMQQQQMQQQMQM
jgi:hypothetical protein